MIPSFVSRSLPLDALKDALDVSARRTRTIADRVARASLGSSDGFALPAPESAGAASADPIDLETEMVSLADEQLHFEATAKLLEKAYAQLRLAIKDR